MSYAEDIFNEQKELIDNMNIEHRNIKKHYIKEKTLGEMLEGTLEEQQEALEITNRFIEKVIKGEINYDN